MAKIEIEPGTEHPDVLELVYWLREVSDEVERMKLATLLGDRVKDELLPEIAAVRRLSAVAARDKLIKSGLTAADATLELARESRQSPQTIMRLISERRQYGG